MTVKELKNVLEKLPDNKIVYVYNWAGAYANITEVYDSGIIVALIPEDWRSI